MKKFIVTGTYIETNELDNIDCDIENVVSDFLKDSGVSNVLTIVRVE